MKLTPKQIEWIETERQRLIREVTDSNDLSKLHTLSMRAQALKLIIDIHNVQVEFEIKEAKNEAVHG